VSGICPVDVSNNKELSRRDTYAWNSEINPRATSTFEKADMLGMTSKKVYGKF